MKKELSELEKKRLLKKNHHQKIDYVLTKAFINDSDVYKLVKDFFAEYLNLDYEFTHEELSKELNKRFIEESLKKEITIFLAQLSHIQFNNDKHPSQDQLRSMISTFKDIISKLIVFEEQKQKNVFLKIKEFFSKLVKTKKSQESSPEKKEKQVQTEKKGIKTETNTSPSLDRKNKDVLMDKGFQELSKVSQSMPSSLTPQSLIIEIEKEIGMNNLIAAKNNYKKLIQLYNGLSDMEKHNYFGKIRALYSKLSKPR